MNSIQILFSKLHAPHVRAFLKSRHSKYVIIEGSARGNRYHFHIMSPYEFLQLSGMSLARWQVHINQRVISCDKVDCQFKELSTTGAAEESRTTKFPPPDETNTVEVN